LVLSITYLPTQEQLQSYYDDEFLPLIFKPNVKLIKLRRSLVLFSLRKFNDTSKFEFNDDNEFLLAFVMDLKFNKTWNLKTKDWESD